MDSSLYGSDEVSRGLSAFIDVVSEQTEAALCTAPGAPCIPCATHILCNRGYSTCRDWREALRILDQGSSAALVTESISREIFELFSQYNSRSGMVQVFDKDDFCLVTRHLPVTQGRFVMVTTDAAIVDASWPILSYAGPIFRWR